MFDSNLVSVQSICFTFLNIVLQIIFSFFSWCPHLSERDSWCWTYIVGAARGEDKRQEEVRGESLLVVLLTKTQTRHSAPRPSPHQLVDVMVTWPQQTISSIL